VSGFEVQLLLGYDGPKPFDDPWTARQLSHEITDDKALRRHQLGHVPRLRGGKRSARHLHTVAPGVALERKNRPSRRSIRLARAIHLIGALSGADTAGRLARLNALRKRLLQESVNSPRPSALPPPRIGDIPKAIVKVLDEAKEPMHVSAIHRAVETHLGRPINPCSVKGRLSEGALRKKPRFERTSYGCYRLP
jgi:hypothetical protein